MVFEGLLLDTYGHIVLVGVVEVIQSCLQLRKSEYLKNKKPLLVRLILYI